MCIIRAQAGKEVIRRRESGHGAKRLRGQSKEEVFFTDEVLRFDFCISVNNNWMQEEDVAVCNMYWCRGIEAGFSQSRVNRRTVETVER